MRHAIWLVGVIVLGGCGPSSDSFVGTENLPSASELASETIQINRDSTVERQNHYLTYELKPDNTLTVTHALDGYQGDQVVGTETFRLTTEEATAFRKSLSRFRPAELRGVEYLIYPEGCQPPIDGGMEVAIAFFGEGEKIGIFGLPFDCKDGNSAQARVTFEGMMRSLPHSKVARGFPQST